MKPTNKLRFVERIVPAPKHGEGIGKTVRILQQWWEFDSGAIPSGEWRDIPVEKEA